MQTPHWNEHLSVGVEHIDAQHKFLLGLVARVGEAVDRDGGEEEAEADLRALCNYAVEHFAAEEALMDMDAYPEYDLHVGQHLECTTMALDFLQSLNEGAQVDLRAFLAFLMEWVKEHIMGVDQTLGRYLKAKASA